MGAKIQKAEDEDTIFVGTWKFKDEEGPITIIFNSDSRLTMNGKSLDFTIVPGGILRIYGDEDTHDYSYTLAENVLSLEYQDGWRIECTKVKSM
jgi:hypothetical protein